MSTEKRRIGILYNPISGRGKGAAAAQALLAPLKKNGFEPGLQPVTEFNSLEERVRYFKTVDYLVLAGGDGTVRSSLEAAGQAKVPLWNLPAGNECLFARKFGMRAGADALLAALAAARIEQHNFGRINGAPFFLMASAGLDAAVIHRLHRQRSGGVSWVNYVLPTLIELLKYDPPRINITVDGQPLIKSQRGLAIAANSKEYAWRLDPVDDADSMSSMLHGRFFPDDGYKFYFGQFKRAFSKASKTADNGIKFCGRKIEITSDRGSVFVQADGEPAGVLPAAIELAEEKVAVLCRS